jgi:catechol 2,3-dioxygenase-like lactoylglutathione lyase family enzyme
MVARILCSSAIPAAVERDATIPSPAAIIGTNHVALTVRGRERSAAFYHAHFGLTERTHVDQHLLILSSDDGSELALRRGEPVSAALPPSNHFGFRLADGAAVRAARKRFRAAGVTEAEWQDDGRFVRVQVFDPDGYRVEFYAH